MNNRPRGVPAVVAIFALAIAIIAGFAYGISARQDAEKWHGMYVLTEALYLGDPYSPELLADIKPAVLRDTQLRARAYLYLGDRGKTSPMALEALRDILKGETDADMRAVGEAHLAKAVKP